MKNANSFWIDEDKRTETVTEYICPECKQRYWFTKDGFCINCGTKLNLFIRFKEHQHDVNAKVIWEVDK